MATYEKNDRNGDEIAMIQRAMGLSPSGKFDAAMVQAVKTWQTAHGQRADGAIGPDMLWALGLTRLLILENGDNGALVATVQAVVGLSGREDYDDDTEAAVAAWQQRQGLKASGSADVATLTRMGLLAAPATRAAPETKSAAPVAGATFRPPINAWAYQLVHIDPAAIAALDVDVAVIDYAAEGDQATAFGPAETARMKARPGGRAKRLVAYMSIGEAETYRFYWQPAWSVAATRPAWLDDENPRWQGNFKVRFWDPAWQAIIFGGAASYLDRIIAAGFDGTYLDIIDAFEYWRDEKRERPDADRQMIAFVIALTRYARAKRPDFLVIPQNGEALLADAGYRAVISAQAKEDIFYGVRGDGKANASGDVSECLDALAYARADGIPIIAVEYVDKAAAIADARRRLADAGCCSAFGPRSLDRPAVGQA